MELLELYNSQQLLTAELSEKLEKTEVLHFWVVNFLSVVNLLFIFCSYKVQ